MVSSCVLVCMATRVLLVSTMFISVITCFSLSASDAVVSGGGGDGGAVGGSSGILLPVDVEEGRPAGPSRSEVVHAWLRSLMTSQLPSVGSRIGVQHRVVVDGDINDNLEEDHKGRYIGGLQRSVVGGQWQTETSRWTRPRRRQLSVVSPPVSDEKEFPIVFSKRNLCCSLDLYCTNCDDQKRKRGGR